jgi:hypothetical protein
MAQYQVRKWNGWHHHMALVMLAMSFLLKEQLAHRVAVKDLTLSDLVFAIDALLPLVLMTRTPWPSSSQNDTNDDRARVTPPIGNRTQLY